MNISVIIPNYNHADYLEKRIESVLNQTYTNFEVIILDDCSTDNSIEIINRYKNHIKITHVIYNKVNSGSTFKQWEKGVTLAKHDYIWIAESDDYADENFLEIAIKKFTVNPLLGLFFCNNNIIDKHNNVTGISNHYPPKFVSHFCLQESMTGKDFCEQYMFFGNFIINASSVVFCKKLFVSTDKSYLHLKICGDWRMWVDLCYTTKITFENSLLNFYRTHSESVRTKNAKVYGMEVIYNYLYFLKKTSVKKIRKQLKYNICRMWVYSIAINKKILPNAILLKNILCADILFPARLAARIINKFKRKRNLELIR